MTRTELERKNALLEASLMRAADMLGDVTEPVMHRFLERFPEAEQAFVTLSLGDSPKLQADMVETTLYCLMTWLNRPQEIRILLGDSVLHHHETLKVDHGWYLGLINAAIDVLVDTVPDNAAAERAVWEDIRQGLGDVLAKAKDGFRGKR